MLRIVQLTWGLVEFYVLEHKFSLDSGSRVSGMGSSRLFLQRELSFCGLSSPEMTPSAACPSGVTLVVAPQSRDSC